MKTFLHPIRRAATAAFSLVELLVAMGLLSFIVMGLLVMFNQTQRAFRDSLHSTDVLEGARAVVDMLHRDILEIAPANRPGRVNNQASCNFLAEVAGTGLRMDLPGTIASRTNVLQRFFFVTRVNQDLIGIGYKVEPDSGLAGVGTLYRWSEPHSPRLAPLTLSQRFTAAANDPNPGAAGFSRIADGIVHLRVTTSAPNGRQLSEMPLSPACYYDDDSTNNPPYRPVLNAVVLNGPLGQEASYFMSNAVPGFVDVEIGMLEPQVLKRVRGMSAAAAADYLFKHVAQVQIFRQRIPIRNVDYSAYQ